MGNKEKAELKPAIIVCPGGGYEKQSLEKRVSNDTPPMFIWHTFEDSCVPVENSIELARALRKNNIPYELHIYPNREHGSANIK